MNDPYAFVLQRLAGIYAPGETRAVARVLFEDAFGMSYADICAGKVRDFSPYQTEQLRNMTERLAQGEPVQYVVGFARFGDLTFEVSPAVLVPRPETLQLVEWAAADLCAHDGNECTHQRILDIGTGSGCIAVTLAKNVGGARVTAVDVSETALDVARRNAQRNNVQADFCKCDILAPDCEVEGIFDAIVSNPPYVCRSESAEMHRNVLCYEPHEAIFVDDNSPLVFYEAVARYASVHLTRTGAVYVEINRRFGRETANVFVRNGFDCIELRNDFENNPRMIKAKRTSHEKNRNHS